MDGDLLTWSFPLLPYAQIFLFDLHPLQIFSQSIPVIDFICDMLYDMVCHEPCWRCELAPFAACLSTEY